MESVATTAADVGNDGDPLRWLSVILWPSGTARIRAERRSDRPVDEPGVATGAAVDPAVGLRWWAAPSPDSPEILIPAGSPDAARSAVRRYHDGMNLKRRARSWSAELLLRHRGLASRVLDHRLVAATGAVDGELPEALAAAVGRLQSIEELHLAVTLARPKSNRKPVLQLIDRDGTCVGWAKIGWNQWTSDLVANEAEWLERRPGGPVIAPRLLDRFDVGGRLVVITSGFVGSRRPRRRPDRLPPTDVFLAIADLGGRTRAQLPDTPWWDSVRRVLEHADDPELQAVERVVDLVGTAELEIGAWHGDLTPWNILSPRVSVHPRKMLRRLRSPGRPAHVIDWEFAADGVPLGFDLCHFHTQVGMEMKGLSAADALDRSARLSPQGLARLGVDPHNQLNVYRLYLIELLRRTLALRAAGIAVDDVEQGRAATDRIHAGPSRLEPVRSSRSR